MLVVEYANKAYSGRRHRIHHHHPVAVVLPARLSLSKAGARNLVSGCGEQLELPSEPVSPLHLFRIFAQHRLELSVAVRAHASVGAAY